MALLKTMPARAACFGRSCLFALVLLPLAFAGGSARAAATSEYDLKATFLFNFTRFVEWPETVVAPNEQPLIIGIVGDDPFNGVLDAIVKGENVNGRPLVVKRFARKDDFAKCHVLFICRSESTRLAEILERVKGRPTLTVSDIDRFAFSGGTIGLVMDQGKVRIEINVDRAKNAQLVISAKLLRPSLIVRDRPQSLLIPSWQPATSHFALVVRRPSLRPGFSRM